jgi:hypothetical protein
MANTTSHVASNNPNAVFPVHGDSAKVLSKVTLPPQSNKPAGVGVAVNLVKVTPVQVFPVPEKK